MAVAIDFCHHNIQPLKDRVRPACFYYGLTDPVRESAWPQDVDSVTDRQKLAQYSAPSIGEEKRSPYYPDEAELNRIDSLDPDVPETFYLFLTIPETDDKEQPEALLIRLLS